MVQGALGLKLRWPNCFAHVQPYCFIITQHPSEMQVGRWAAGWWDYIDHSEPFLRHFNIWELLYKKWLTDWCAVMTFGRLTIGLLLISRRAGRAAVHVAKWKVAVSVARRGTGDDRGTILENEKKKHILHQNHTVEALQISVCVHLVSIKNVVCVFVYTDLVMYMFSCLPTAVPQT